MQRRKFRKTGARVLREYGAVNPPPHIPDAARTWSLRPHPASAWLPAFGLRVAVQPLADGLWLDYALTGDLDGLLLPAPQVPGHADGLWRHTCLEAFVIEDDGRAYREFNFSPTGQWAHYRFSNQRVPDLAPAVPLAAPMCEWRTTPGLLSLRARLPALPASPDTDRRLGLSAVLEHRDGRLSYWALAHPAARPDFHDPAGWRTLPCAG